MNILKDSFKDSIRYILTRVFVLLIVGVIFIAIFYFLGKKNEKLYTYLGIEKAYAYTWKYGMPNNIITRQYSGVITNNNTSPNTEVGFALSPPSVIDNPGNYDYMGIKFLHLSFKNYADYTSTSQNVYCDEWAYHNLTQVCPGGDCSTPLAYQDIECIGTNSSGYNSSTFAEGTISFRAHIQDSDNKGYPCFFTTEFDSMLICPIGPNIKKVSFYINSSYKRTEYNFEIDPSFYFYNQDSTEIVNALQGLNQNQQTIINSITDYSTTSSGTSFATFMNNYTNTIPNNITRIVATPLQTIVNLQGATCSPLQLTIPFINQTFTLPCMSNIYQQYFGAFFNLYQLIVSGLVTYWCIIGILNTAKSLLDANDDKIEVLDL